MKKQPFILDRDTSTAPWMQLRQWLVSQIEEGYFEPGEKMPTIRALASEVSMNNNTISKAYTSLINDGYLSSRQGSGVFVSSSSLPEKDERAKTVDFILENCVGSCRDLGLSFDDIEKVMKMRLRTHEIKEKEVQHEN